jgi:glucose-1-phosphate thymidylyltransferase
MKGIVLAGGTGSRLWPITLSISKQLLPIYDKPMIYYPISTLMLAGVREILMITTPHDQSQFMELLGDGSDLGISIQYAIQAEPKGLAQALIIAENYLSGNTFLMILGDNLFHGVGLGNDIARVLPHDGAHVFTYEVVSPSDYGVLKIDSNNIPISILEKPKVFVSNLAVTGLYFFDSNAPEIAKSVNPSERGELEITSVLDFYLKSKLLTFTQISRGSAWLDTGNPASMHDASTYVRVMEERTGLKIACLEEIALQKGWITPDKVMKDISKYKQNAYGSYIEKLIQNEFGI